MKRSAFFVLVSLIGAQAYSNNDSLWNVWSNESLVDTVRLAALNDLINSDEIHHLPDSANLLIEYMLTFARSTGNRSYEAHSYRQFADVHFRDLEYVDAEKDYIKVVEIAKEIEDKSQLAGAYWKLGVIYYWMGQNSRSIENYSLSLELQEELGRSTSGLLNNIGLIYEAQKDYVRAMEYFQKSADAAHQRGDTNLIALGNIGDVHSKQGNYSLALEHFHELIKIYEKNKGGYYDCYMKLAYHNIGQTHLRMNELELAMDYFMRSLEHDKKDSACIGATIYETVVGALYDRMGRSDLAIDWCNIGYTRSKKFDMIEDQRSACECLFRAYKKVGNDSKALEYLELTNLLNDSLDKEATAKSLQQMEYAKLVLADSLKQEEDKLKMTIAHQKEVRKKERTRNIYLGAGLFLLLAAISLYTRMRLVRKARDRIEEERKKAVRSEAFKQQFLANMSHEIRTPMNAVMGMTSLLLDKQPREDQLKYLDGIRTSGDNLLHIINDILDLAKFESGNLELEHIDLSLKACIDHVKNTLSLKAAEKGLELLTNIRSDVEEVVLGDPIRLNQVLINLTGNAIKFTEKGSVSIEVRNDPNGVRFSIIDTGIGIPDDKLKSVFEDFTQASASDTRLHGGTGLGLNISRQLVDIMGGKITVESKEGYGTTFSFVLDLEAGSAEKLEERLAHDNEVDGSILDGLRILITDDNEYNRIVAKDTLMSKANVEIHEAEDGQAAIDLVSKMPFDVILMDIQMPGMNGFDATRHIRSHFEDPIKDTPIIALTASVLRTDLDKCKQAGMDSYIPKPFKAQQLIIGIAQVLGIKLKMSEHVSKEIRVEATTMPGSITDMTYLNEFCEGDAEKMKKYVRMFTSTAPALIDKIRTALDNDDPKDIADQVHAFKTKWVMMGMTSTKDLALELERQCREGDDQDDIAQKAELLIDHINWSLDELIEA